MSSKKFNILKPDALGKRIVEIAGNNYAEIARRVGLTNAAVWYWFHGKSPAVDTLHRFASAYGVNLHWLITGEGPKKILAAREERSEYKLEKSDRVEVQCVLITMAGEPSLQPAHLDPEVKGGYSFKRSSLERWDDISTRKNMWITARLDKRAESMRPTLQPGSIVLVNRRVEKFLAHPKSIDGRVFLITLDEDVATKRLFVDGRILEASSDNRAYRSRHLDLEHTDLARILIGHIVWQGGEVK